MKKVYKKPEVHMEHFTLSQSIALGCGNPIGTPTQGSKDTCGWSDGFENYWLSPPACGDSYPEDFEIEGICYDNPSGGATIFTS